MNDTKPTKERKPFRDSEGSIFKKVVERATHTGRTKKETVYVARIRYKDLDGIPREKKRVADSHADAIIKRREIREEIEKELDPSANLVEAPKTFSELADYFETEFIKPAEYVKNQKVSGINENLVNAKYQMNLFREYFGKRLLKTITYEDIRQYKLKRLKTPVKVIKKVKTELSDEEKTKRREINPKDRTRYKVEKVEMKSQRALSSVHRELTRLKTMLYVAVRQKWLQENPFSRGLPLIVSSHETQRVRVLSAEEEVLLMAAAQKSRSELLPKVITFAIDTFMRRGEIFKLTWKMVDIENRLINLPPKITKTNRSRSIPLSQRVIDVLNGLPQGKANDRVFGIQSNLKDSFERVVKIAGLKDFRFHDLRATGITRLLRMGMMAPEVMKFSGHTDYRTFMKYVRPDDDTFEKARHLMDNFTGE